MRGNFTLLHARFASVHYPAADKDLKKKVVFSCWKLPQPCHFKLRVDIMIKRHTYQLCCSRAPTAICHNLGNHNLPATVHKMMHTHGANALHVPSTVAIMGVGMSRLRSGGAAMPPAEAPSPVAELPSSMSIYAVSFRGYCRVKDGGREGGGQS